MSEHRKAVPRNISLSQEKFRRKNSLKKVKRRKVNPINR